jgi:hypothetical protein
MMLTLYHECEFAPCHKCNPGSYPHGSIIEVVYDPANPDDLVLKERSFMNGMGWVLLTLLLLMVLVVLWGVCWRLMKGRDIADFFTLDAITGIC